MRDRVVIIPIVTDSAGNHAAILSMHKNDGRTITPLDFDVDTTACSISASGVMSFEKRTGIHLGAHRCDILYRAVAGDVVTTCYTARVIHPLTDDQRNSLSNKSVYTHAAFVEPFRLLDDPGVRSRLGSDFMVALSDLDAEARLRRLIDTL